MIIAAPGQNIIDVAIASKMKATNFIDLAFANNILDVTAEIIPGQQFISPTIKSENFLSFEELLKNLSAPVKVDVISYPNQSITDIALQHDGNALAVFDWAINNNLNPTDNVAPGQKFKIIESSERRSRVAKYFQGNNIVIATQRKPKITFQDFIFPGEFPFSF